MTLKNAFGDLALDASIKKLLDGYVTSPGMRKVLDGKFFIAGSPIVLAGTLTSTNNPALQLSNPATSGKIAFVVGLTIYSTVAQQVHYIENATMAGTVTTLIPTNVNRSSSMVSSLTASWSTTEPTGGTRWPNESRVVDELQLTLPPIVLPPNKSFTIVGESSAAHTFTANAYYIEEPLG